MQKVLVKYKKVITSIACSPLILASNNLELAAKYLPNKLEELLEKGDNLFLSFEIDQKSNLLIANNEEITNNENVLISEIIIEGWEDHPEGRKLELAAYDSMTIKPGSIINNQNLKKDLNSIYASGWFSGVKIKSEDGPLGVRLIVNVVPNPILKKVEINPLNSVVPREFVDDIFNFYGTTLNLNELQNKINL